MNTFVRRNEEEPAVLGRVERDKGWGWGGPCSLRFHIYSECKPGLEGWGGREVLEEMTGEHAHMWLGAGGEDTHSHAHANTHSGSNKEKKKT